MPSLYLVRLWLLDELFGTETFAVLDCETVCVDDEDVGLNSPTMKLVELPFPLDAVVLLTLNESVVSPFLFVPLPDCFELLV